MAGRRSRSGPARRVRVPHRPARDRPPPRRPLRPLLVPEGRLGRAAGAGPHHRPPRLPRPPGPGGARDRDRGRRARRHRAPAPQLRARRDPLRPRVARGRAASAVVHGRRRHPRVHAGARRGRHPRLQHAERERAGRRALVPQPPARGDVPARRATPGAALRPRGRPGRRSARDVHATPHPRRRLRGHPDPRPHARRDRVPLGQRRAARPVHRRHPSTSTTANGSPPFSSRASAPPTSRASS